MQLEQLDTALWCCNSSNYVMTIDAAPAAAGHNFSSYMKQWRYSSSGCNLSRYMKLLNATAAALGSDSEMLHQQHTGIALANSNMHASVMWECHSTKKDISNLLCMQHS